MCHLKNKLVPTFFFPQRIISLYSTLDISDLFPLTFIPGREALMYLSFLDFLLPYLTFTLVCRWMVWLGIIFSSCFIYLDTLESCNLLCLDPFTPTSYARGEKKNHLV